MPSPYFLLLLALVGHLGFWVAALNRLHAISLPCWLNNRLTDLIRLVIVGIPVGFLWWWITRREVLAFQSFSGVGLQLIFDGYLVSCWLLAPATLAIWLWRRVGFRPPPQLIANHTVRLDLATQSGRLPLCGITAKLFQRIPGNQIFQLHVQEKSISLPQMSPALDGLSIVHLTDLHFTGKLDKSYFEQIVRHTNDLDADIVAITGDIFDKARYVDWIPDTLEKFTSRHGVYFVLGNHDKRIRNISALRRCLTGAGLVDLGGRWIQIEISGQPVLLAGNELPWFGPAPKLADGPGPAARGGPLRILLSHSPDQIGWARARHFDLMLAGHTHGGQIRLPLIGPVVCPSRHGMKYAAGLFHEQPTLLHVSRGISSATPLRIGCPPELAKLVLRT